ncbi:prolyl oligopeptidase family serine peptidase [Flavobacteriaceae bacterium F89]|uniref:Prolyl oligopeptidase family serine peptidase n=1 Tax=Cerina litoralis TaxID=2874477 RepID=A0AAE3EU71_9FLAO|nr:PHB depolymerase family esterase [Cerina litoralis]MCG2460510.1 prolyl oligopeptidase family serine peptidase [Cerina litoralis]
MKRDMGRFLGFILVFFSMQGCSAQTQIVEGEMHTVSREDLSYYLYFPKDYETRPKEKFPILLFLHGGGESGDRLDSIKKSGPPKLLAQGKQFPFLILAPQNLHKKQWWNTRAVIQLLDSIVADNRVDKNRIYLTGLSRGGGAAWEMAVTYPDKFAALAVVCGMAPVPYASWINRDMPIWVFHGEEDKSIPISESIAMVAKLRQMGYDVKFTKYPGVGHNAWDKAYTTPELYSWLMQQVRK